MKLSSMAALLVEAIVGSQMLRLRRYSRGLHPTRSASLEGGLAGRLAALAGIDPANPDSRVMTPPENGLYNDELSQSWLFRALTGRLR